jgi:hypothetical protein
MKRCAFLTMASLDGYVSDDALVAAPLAARGWKVEFVDWRSDADWSAFDLAVIRSTWDYHRRLDEYLETLASIAAATRLLNDLGTVRWNARKTYLNDLAERGVDIVPTWFGELLDGERLERLFARFDTDELVVKPSVGANAIDTRRIPRNSDRIQFSGPGNSDRHRFSNSDRIRFSGNSDRHQFSSPGARESRATVPAVFDGRQVMVQPFLRGVVEEGEFSLVYFAGELSHAILKTPRAGDFRVQEEHGGTIVAVEPEPELAAAGRAVLDRLDQTPLYARIDLVRSAPRSFQAMEVELIEPSLYLRTDEAAPERFADAIAAVEVSRR